MHRELYQWGYLAAWLSPSIPARRAAEAAAALLDTTVYYAARAYGPSVADKVARFAKMFLLGGNERLRALAERLRPDTLRRVVKTVPALVTGEPGNPVEAAALAVAEIGRARWLRREAAAEYARLVYYALTGQEPDDSTVDTIVAAALARKKTGRG